MVVQKAELLESNNQGELESWNNLVGGTVQIHKTSGPR